MARLEQRLEDTIARVDTRLLDLAGDLRALAPLVVAHAEMAVKLTAVVEEARAAHKAVEDLEDHLAARDERQRREEAVREDERRKERKRDRQWYFGAVFVAASFIIGAVQVLLG